MELVICCIVAFVAGFGVGVSVSTMMYDRIGAPTLESDRRKNVKSLQ